MSQPESEASSPPQKKRPKKTHQAIFEERLEELRRYKEEHNGRTNVPSTWKPCPKLGKWVSSQRKSYNEGKLPPTRIAALNDLGFEWAGDPTGDDKFEVRFNELCSYKLATGHCKVPNVFESNPQLGRWVARMRACCRQFRQGKKTSITQEQIEKLNSIGFVWSLRTRTPWDEKFEALKLYREEHGDCDVPYRHKRLGEWVTEQRRQRRSGAPYLTVERMAKLESIGFRWHIGHSEAISRAAVRTERFGHNPDDYHAARKPRRKNNAMTDESGTGAIGDSTQEVASQAENVADLTPGSVSLDGSNIAAIQHLRQHYEGKIASLEAELREAKRTIIALQRGKASKRQAK